MSTIIAISIFMLTIIGASGESEWWKSMSLYQIYPRSFKDSDGDGVGDLKGVQSKLQHLADTKINAFWLSPIYPSPMVDFGYDISDFRGIDSIFGTMEDLQNLLNEAHKLNIKVIMDFVPNHSSDKHEWFEKSVKKIYPYTDYYVWHEGKFINGTRYPPNNWVSQFYGSAWTWNEKRQAYYLHQFAAGQPDLNYRNKYVVEEMKDVLRFWLNKGVDGFRVDAIPGLFEAADFRDEPLSGITNDPSNYSYTLHYYTTDLDETYDMVKQWSVVLNEYDSRIMMMETYSNMSKVMQYYETGATFPFNFGLIQYVNNQSRAEDFKKVVDNWIDNQPSGTTSNWVAGNHDKRRIVARFGHEIGLVVTIMVQLLPGVAVTYNGEEIGMEDTWLTWEQTKDPQGCNAGPKGYETASRDPARTPFQWDNTTSAGFSTNPNTWLPVNKNYKTLNLATQKETDNSYYKSFLTITKLRQLPAVKRGSLQTVLLNNDVFAFSRELQNETSIYLVTNYGYQSQTVDLAAFKNVPSELHLYYTTSDAGTRIGEKVKTNAVRVPARGAAVFITADYFNDVGHYNFYEVINVE